MKLEYLYRCARSNGSIAQFAIKAAHEYIAGPLAKYNADLEAWNAQPDKRTYAPGGSANRPKFPSFYKMRSNAAHGPTFSRDERGRWKDYANIPTCVLDGLRDVGNVDEIRFDHPGEREIYRALVEHRGWFADEDQTEIYRGHVWQLPARNGARVYLAGYSESASGYSVLCARNGALETFDTLREAIQAADSLAERMAEDAREYSERWQEAASCAWHIETAKKDAARVRKDWRELALAAQTPRMREMRDEARAEHAGIIATIAAKRERIAELDMQGEF